MKLRSLWPPLLLALTSSLSSCQAQAALETNSSDCTITITNDDVHFVIRANRIDALRVQRLDKYRSTITLYVGDNIWQKGTEVTNSELAHLKSVMGLCENK